MAHQSRRYLSVDSWLNTNGYYRKVIPHDGSCIFRAVSEQIYYTQIFHEYIRTECVKFAKEYSEEFRQCSENDWDNYLKNLGAHLITCGQFEMKIISKRFKRDIVLFDSSNLTSANVTNNGYEHKIYLCYIGDEHYDSVFRTKLMETAGYCQSLVYTLLYENIFLFNNVEDIATGMLCVAESITTKYTLTANSTTNLQISLKSTASSNHTPVFSYKVAKAIDPNQYRNIDYDVWNQFKKDRRNRSGNRKLRIMNSNVQNVVAVKEEAKANCADSVVPPHSTVQPAHNVDLMLQYEEQVPFVGNVSQDAAVPWPNGMPANGSMYPGVNGNVYPGQYYSLPHVVPVPACVATVGVPLCHPFFIPAQSLLANGSDLPFYDVNVLRYYFNLGIQYMHQLCRMSEAQVSMNAAAWLNGAPPMAPVAPPLISDTPLPSSTSLTSGTPLNSGPSVPSTLRSQYPPPPNPPPPENTDALYTMRKSVIKETYNVNANTSMYTYEENYGAVNTYSAPPVGLSNFEPVATSTPVPGNHNRPSDALSTPTSLATTPIDCSTIVQITPVKPPLDTK